MSKLVVLLLCFLQFTAKADRLEISCLSEGGRIVQQFTCPQSAQQRSGPFCLLPDGRFYNGCTGLNAQNGHGKLFFEACKLHDHCYHQEPSTSGLQRKQCDKKFYRNLKRICDKDRKGHKSCKIAAYALYQAVRVGGEDSWECSNFYAEYPDQLKLMNRPISLMVIKG